jgi:hypothetical protein
VELPKLLSVCAVRVVFCLIVSTCSFYFSLVSRVSPRYLHVGDGFISPHSVWMGASTSMRLRDLMKWVSWNLPVAKTDACVVAATHPPSRGLFQIKDEQSAVRQGRVEVGL